MTTRPRTPMTPEPDCGHTGEIGAPVCLCLGQQLVTAFLGDDGHQPGPLFEPLVDRLTAEQRVKLIWQLTAITGSLLHRLTPTDEYGPVPDEDDETDEFDAYLARVSAGIRSTWSAIVTAWTANR
ncbi:hypothetical protein [Candidatus Protofrankia californiensis]|uniref:hypothetical protein n=1 Tax=Candidatus Protofrankia californiensis TaxID=1839754 RepID=UPI00104143BA|nr:hypothetical protein [Candidatus Protofrankia californiensis]